ncbi:MAG: type II toxin-antitoxin system HicB family antitoxin [Hyphomicrobiaceae bacterium]
MNLRIELEQEEDGRWIAEVPELPGVLAYGVTPKQAAAKVQVIALRVLAERLERGDDSLGSIRIDLPSEVA